MRGDISAVTFVATKNSTEVGSTEGRARPAPGCGATPIEGIIALGVSLTTQVAASNRDVLL
jgi:hypothetical protein